MARHRMCSSSNLKTYNFSFLLLFVLIRCRSGEIVVGQAEFSSPPVKSGKLS